MNTLTVSDLHGPYNHPSAWDFLADLNRAYKPALVVVLGDEVDFTAYGRYVKHPKAPGADDELRRARESLKPLFKLFPGNRPKKQRVVVVEGNHTMRPGKRATEAGLPDAFMRGIGEVLDAPKAWQWHTLHHEDGTVFVHGDGFSGKNAALTAAVQYRRNVVIGHVHAYAGVQYSSGPYDRIWGMNAGCLIDPWADCFQYAKYMANRPTLGTGIIVDGVPSFVPLR